MKDGTQKKSVFNIEIEDIADMEMSVNLDILSSMTVALESAITLATFIVQRNSSGLLEELPTRIGEERHQLPWDM